MSEPGLETPPKPLPTAYINEDAETPGPYRARISNLRTQVAKLVKESQQDRRRYQAELAERDGQIAQLHASAKDALLWRRLAEDKAEELKQMKEAGEGMRAELNAHSVIAQEKALLALANEQLRMVEMEQRLLQARAASLMRDHKISLFKAKEEDLNAELVEKDAQLQDLENALEEANTSLAHQRAADAKSSHLAASLTQKDLDEALRKAASHEGKVAGLEAKLAASKEREEQLMQELDDATKESKAGAADNEKRELQKALRAAKSDASKREDEMTDLREELAALKQSSKEREEKWKVKAKEAMAERDRLADVEEELKAARRVKVSPKKTEKQPVKARKPASSDESEPEIALPKKKTKKESPKRKAKADDSDSDVPVKPSKVMAKSTKVNTVVVAPSRKADTEKTASGAQAKAMAGEENDKPEPEKKKKRKLGLSKPAFQWDPILSSGDGVIPTTLSPARPPDRTGRAGAAYGGFSAATSRGISRFQ